MRKLKFLFSLFLTMGGCALSADEEAETPIVVQQPQVSQEEPRRILFLMQSGNVDKALKLYEEYHTRTGKHDFDLLQTIGLGLIDQGYNKGDAESQLMSIFGAGISANENALYILEAGLKSRYPQIQLVSLSYLARFQNDTADLAVNHALGSPMLIIRLEALMNLAGKKYPSAVGQAEALMYKVDNELLPLFPRIYAMVGNDSAIHILKRLMSNPKPLVRLASILSAAEYGRDDLLPQIRMMASDISPAQQEACAVAFGMMKDESSASKLETLSQSSCSNVKLASLQALCRLGRKTVRPNIEEMARGGNLYAINVLGDIAGSEDVLYDLMKSSDLNIRINASISLLERKDSRSLPGIAEILLRDSRDLAFVKTSSQGHALHAWKAVPSASAQYEKNPVAFELSVHVRENILLDAVDLPEKDFLMLASALLDRQQNDLVPAITTCLESLRSPASIAVLKKYQQKVGAPLIRNYCNLALYRLKEEGPYADILRDWLRTKQSEEMIQFRPLLPLEMREKDSSYQLTPQETSRLLVDTFEAFAKSQDDKGVEALIEAIQDGNNKNRFALAGLLMRATQ